MELSLLVIFWYGILHAFGPDHLTAIADFSIGKDKPKTLLITVLFAVGHGISLFIFAKVLEKFPLSHAILEWGDVISAAVIIVMGVYLLFMVFTNRIHLKKHIHKGKEHLHIWFGTSHEHESKNHHHHHLWSDSPYDNDETVAKSSSFTMGLLMGAGGVRGMLITLGAVGSGHVDFSMVGAFTAGVMVVFVGFGFVILTINKHLLDSLSNVRRVFATAGVVSLIVGTNILIG